MTPSRWWNGNRRGKGKGGNGGGGRGVGLETLTFNGLNNAMDPQVAYLEAMGNEGTKNAWYV